MKLSVVTVCFNAEKTICRCIESVLGIDKIDYEYLIIDGKSTDNTVKYARQYEDEFNKKGVPYRIITEKDNGIYDAMNKGIQIAQGEWVLYLNSDDIFCSNKCLNVFFEMDLYTYDVVYGDVVVRENNTLRYQKAKNLELLYSGTEMPFCHQSTFTKKNILQKYMFNTAYKIIADIDLFLSMYEDKAKFLYIPGEISIFSNDGISQTHRYESIKEGKTLLKNHKKYTLKKRIILNTYLLYYKTKKYIPKSILVRIKKQ